MGWQERQYARGDKYAAPRSSYGRRGYSIVTILLIVNVVLYMLCSMGRGTPGGSMIDEIGVMHIGSVLHGQVWRLITSQYLHAGMMHLLFNMIALHFLGRPLEQAWSPKKFFTIYTLSGLAGNLLYVVLGLLWLGTGGFALGASGCVLGLLGAAAVMFPQATIYIHFLFPVPIRSAAALFMGLYVLNIFVRGANAGGDAAHLAGLLFGGAWAWRGDRWWARLMSSKPRGPRPASSSPGINPGAWKRKMDALRDLDREVDRVLSKVKEHGIHSLTAKERKILQKASESERQREGALGRTDRL